MQSWLFFLFWIIVRGSIKYLWCVVFIKMHSFDRLHISFGEWIDRVFGFTWSRSLIFLFYVCSRHHTPLSPPTRWPLLELGMRSRARGCCCPHHWQRSSSLAYAADTWPRPIQHDADLDRHFWIRRWCCLRLCSSQPIPLRAFPCTTYPAPQPRERVYVHGLCLIHSCSTWIDSGASVGACHLAPVLDTHAMRACL